jgi:hypothetical protein
VSNLFGVHVRRAYLEDVAVADFLPSFVVLKHLFQYLGFVLNLDDFLGSLGSIIGLVSGVIASHDFHEPIRFL